MLSSIIPVVMELSLHLEDMKKVPDVSQAASVCPASEPQTLCSQTKSELR